jgi:predicted glycoside hydrolase/deacetylase ChbG (UPF0249 family)
MLVIFHGDDFGLTSGVNEGVIRAFHDGILTSASIIPCTQASDEAIGLARTNPDLDVGIHLVYTDEKSLHVSNERFPSRQRLLIDLLTGQRTIQQVEKEWRTQIEKILSAGIRVSHLDSHQHVHLYPYLFPLTVRLATEYNIPCIRSRIIDPLLSVINCKRLMDCMILKCWIAGYVSMSRISPLQSIASIGFLHAGGNLNQQILIDMLIKLDKQKYPAVEVMLHPGIGDPHTQACYRNWHYHWKNDLDLVVDPLMLTRLKDIGVIPISYAQIIQIGSV